MVDFKKYKLGDEIYANGWNNSFVVNLIHKGYIVAINKKGIMPVYLFIKTYTNEVFYGSSRFQKYNLKNKQDIKDLVDSVIRGEVKFDYDNCSPAELILDNREFVSMETRDQVKYE